MGIKDYMEEIDARGFGETDDQAVCLVRQLVRRAVWRAAGRVSATDVTIVAIRAA
jgi:hypothetical protein